MLLFKALAEYALPAALITMLPGPDTAMLITTAVKGGRRAAVRAAFGVGTGLLVWGLVAALGLAAALHSSAGVYEVFRLVCAAYLLLLGGTTLNATIRRRSGGKSSTQKLPTLPTGSIHQLPTLNWGYRRALITCLLNPKLGIFFVALLPQFVPSGAPAAPTLLALSTLQAVEATIWYLALGKVAHIARNLLQRTRVRNVLDRVAGTAYLIFGLRLILRSD